MRRFWKYALFAVLSAVFISGCSKIADGGYEGTAGTTGLSKVSLRVPDYKSLASGARAVAPQTAAVRLSPQASTQAFTAITKSLSEGNPVYEEASEDHVAGTKYTFTFEIPVGIYAENTLKVELFDSSESLLSCGYNTSSVTVTESGASIDFVLLPCIENEDNTSGSLKANEMKFIKVTVSANSSIAVTETGDVSLFKFDSNGKFAEKLALSEGTATITNSTSADVSYYIGIYSAAEVQSYTVTVKKEGAETLTWDFANASVGMYADKTLSTEVAADGNGFKYIQNSDGTAATAYLKGSSSGDGTASMKVEAPVLGSKIAIRNSSSNKDAQVNAGAVLYIPVSTGSVVTVTQRSSGEYELGGEKSLTYTASKSGYVVYDVISNHYLSSIVVTDVYLSEEHSADIVSFVSKTDSSTANTTDVLGFTAASVYSSDESVAAAGLTSNSGYITITSKAAGSATITAKGSGSEETSWSVTVRRYGNIIVGGITPYTSVSSVESAWLKIANPGSGESDAVNVQGGRVVTDAGKFVYLNRKFASGTKVRIEATTSSYTTGTKTLDVGFIGTPAKVLSDIGIYSTAAGANSGKTAGNSTNGWQGEITGSSPYKYVCEYTFDGNSSVTNKSNHYLYDSGSDTANNKTYYYKTGVSPKASVSSGYAVFGDTSNKVTFTLIEVYENDSLVYSSATSEAADDSVSSSFSFSFLYGSSDISVKCKDNGSGSYTFTATPPSSSASCTYAWYVDLSEISGQATSSLTTTVSTAGAHAVLVAATDSETGVVYTAQYTLTVK